MSVSRVDAGSEDRVVLREGSYGNWYSHYSVWENHNCCCSALALWAEQERSAVGNGVFHTPSVLVQLGWAAKLTISNWGRLNLPPSQKGTAGCISISRMQTKLHRGAVALSYLNRLSCPKSLKPVRKMTRCISVVWAHSRTAIKRDFL